MISVPYHRLRPGVEAFSMLLADKNLPGLMGESAREFPLSQGPYWQPVLDLYADVPAEYSRLIEAVEFAVWDVAPEMIAQAGDLAPEEHLHGFLFEAACAAAVIALGAFQSRIEAIPADEMLRKAQATGIVLAAARAAAAALDAHLLDQARRGRSC